MAAIKEVATQFFEACEAGKGWEACKAYCKPDATFSAQAEPLADVRTLQAYADWMQGLMKMLPDGRYDLKSFATDDQRANVTAYAVFSGTHTGRADRRRPASARVPTTSTP
jgi:predicted ester cyclase